VTAAPSTLDRILADDGPIARALIASGVPFEHRPEQGIMARAAMDAMESRSRLLAEAGTGVGKSFAYLVPAILRAVLHNETVVVATATISLQEQLIQKDIPLLQRTLADWDLGPAARALVPVLAKGRGNYLSIRRLKIASERQDSILYDAESKTSLHALQPPRARAPRSLGPCPLRHRQLHGPQVPDVSEVLLPGRPPRA
jgi:ATP-dependent DNA helicase DinG